MEGVEGILHQKNLLPKFYVLIFFYEVTWVIVGWQNGQNCQLYKCALSFYCWDQVSHLKMVEPEIHSFQIESLNNANHGASCLDNSTQLFAHDFNQSIILDNCYLYQELFLYSFSGLATNFCDFHSSVTTRAEKSKSLIRWKRLKGGKRRKKANLIYN